MDEVRELPDSLKRGVLSEDGIYDMLDNYIYEGNVLRDQQDHFLKYSVVADIYITYNRIDIRKGGIAYVQYLKIPPGDGGLISIRGLKRSLPTLIY